MEFSKVLLEDIYKKVRVDGKNAMDVCMVLGEEWGYKRSQRNELFKAYMEYCIENKVVS